MSPQLAQKVKILKNQGIFGVWYGDIRDNWKFFWIFFFNLKKNKGNLSKIQTLAFEQGVIDVLSKKVKIIRVRQVEPSIEYLESGKRKRLFKVVESYFPDSKY